MINTASPRAGERLLQQNQTQNDKKVCKRMVGTPRVPANACSNQTKLRTTKRFASAGAVFQFP